MRDFAVSDHPAVQAQLDRLGALAVPRGRLSLDPVRTLLARLGNPQRRLPPVFHVAGTNGKGSTCAFLRAMLEAQGARVHAFTSPHLVRFNERIRIAGKLVEDDELAELLKTVLDADTDIGASFFEVSTAAAFLAFARHPADACVIEVGLGGRFDSTNVLERPTICGVASLGIDHEAFLLAPEEDVPTVPIERIAFEKAGIAKPGVPLVTGPHPDDVEKVIAATVRERGGELLASPASWSATVEADRMTYRDARGVLDLPLPTMPGEHQAANAALAVAMLRHQDEVPVSADAIARGIVAARWPARLQKLGDGPLTAALPDRTVWVDGGHNPDAAWAIAAAMRGNAPLDLVFGLLANRDIASVLGPLAPLAQSLRAVPIPGHEHHDPQVIARLARDRLGIAKVSAAASLESALEDAAGDAGGAAHLLIAGSLYLAGEVLRLNRELPQ
ncbi:bifunctional folylpolyglutamate synthase/dihydrofolate synthase [Novosphingobium tardum]|uniref:Dihydrofolate synthase/folylpolyglutamate synthase n=1 Tax=Novosphingobium tardum TaxID=1538021 RepID=A0ABV8RS32_9SPHN